MKYKLIICLFTLLSFSFSGALDPLPVDFTDDNLNAKKKSINLRRGINQRKNSRM